MELGMWNDGDFAVQNPIVYGTACLKIFTITLTFTTLYISNV